MRNLRLVSAAVVLACLSAGASAAHAADDRPPRRLIEFGWDEPDTAFLRTHLAELDASPFDGCVFHAGYEAADGKRGSLTWQCWGTRSFTEAELKAAFADLRAVQPARMRHNFLRFNTTPAKLDWFDDHGPIIANARLAAQLARAGPCDGILLDIEQYEGKLFNYRHQRDHATKSWNDYAAQARQRGREVMTAFQQGYPDLTVFLTFGYTLPWKQSDAGKTPLADCDYGLLAPFLDGMTDAANGNARIVDGHELSYGTRDPARFRESYRTIKEGVLPIVADRDRYVHTFSAGFGLWMDYDWRKQGWNTDDVARNHFSPEAFETSLREALSVADAYVWIYTETPRWWSAEGKPVKLPAAYAEAVRRARRPSAH